MATKKRLLFQKIPLMKESKKIAAMFVKPVLSQVRKVSHVKLAKTGTM